MPCQPGLFNSDAANAKTMPMSTTLELGCHQLSTKMFVDLFNNQPPSVPTPMPMLLPPMPMPLTPICRDDADAPPTS
jgi:hypothetical protein